MSSAEAADPNKVHPPDSVDGLHEVARQPGSVGPSAPPHQEDIAREGAFWHTNRSKAMASSAICGPQP
jgi:hypothetical protein